MGPLRHDQEVRFKYVPVTQSIRSAVLGPAPDCRHRQRTVGPAAGASTCGYEERRLAKNCVIDLARPEPFATFISSAGAALAMRKNQNPVQCEAIRSSFMSVDRDRPGRRRQAMSGSSPNSLAATGRERGIYVASCVSRSLVVLVLINASV